jgi:FkbM family methyltransferase
MGMDLHLEQDGLYAQGSEYAIIGKLLPYLKHKSFVDIGAEKGAFSRFLLENQFTGTIFEPCPKHHAVLMDLAKANGSRFLPYAIDSTDRIADFYIASDEKGEPLDYYHSLHYLSDDPRVNHSKKIPVTCRSLESLFNEGMIPENIGVLKIDTEGNDLQVIKGMGGILPEVLICEFFTKGLYAGWDEASPEGLISMVKEILGYDHYLAIKRFHDNELISPGPSVFLEAQWGNLIFMETSLFNKAFEDIESIIASSERKLLDFQSVINTLNAEIEMLRRVCNERLKLINFLSDEAAKRGELILQLQHQSKKDE